MCPDYFSMENPLADIHTRTRKEESLLEQLNQMNESAKFHNSQKANEKKPITRPLKRFCGLCEAPLKSIKPKTLEDLDLPLPRYRCTLCKSVYQGYGLELFHESKKSVKGIVFEMDGTL